MFVFKTSVGIAFAFRKIPTARLSATISTKFTMAVGIGLNVFSICWNIYTIYSESISLARGEQSEASKFIRACVVLLRSEVDCWTRIHDPVGLLA